MEPFKNNINPGTIKELARRVSRAAPGFDARGFQKSAIHGLETLELKPRIRHAAATLWDTLAMPFPKAAPILVASAGPPLEDEQTDTNAWLAWILNQVVEDHGLDHFSPAMDAIYELTQRCSSEFAIRPFLQAYEKDTLKRLASWTKDPSQHVRRLVSEGTRPRLPWGMRLHRFVQDPAPGLALLERLKDDASPYVRRSVANHLNDISKDHPARAVATAQAWLSRPTPHRRWIVSHALRGLVKSGHQDALALLDLRPAAFPEVRSFALSSKHAALGGSLLLTLTLHNPHAESLRLALDYAVHHQKKNGTLSPKVFKWKILHIAPGETLTLEKSHSLRPVTTRVYYPGEHRVTVHLSGKNMAQAVFTLSV